MKIMRRLIHFWGILFILVLAACTSAEQSSSPEPTATATATLVTPTPGTVGGSWSTRADMPTPRWGLSTCVVDGKIYAIGGAGPVYEALNTVEVYDPTTDTWTAKSPMPTARQNLTTSVVDGKIYAIGGISADSTSWQSVEVFSTVEVYDPATDTWTTKSPMPSARLDHYAHVVDGKIFILGGSNTGYPLHMSVFTIEVYDPVTDTWTQQGEYLGGTKAGASTMVDGKIYIFGGGPENQKFYKYDLATDTWTQKSMSMRRLLPTASELDGKIYLFGGASSSSGGTSSFHGAQTVEVYDPVADTWAIAPDMPTGRTDPDSCIVDGKIYVIGGIKYWIGDTYSVVEVFEP